MVEHTSVQRRKFLALSTAAATGVALAGCGGPGAGDADDATGPGTAAGPEEGAGGDVQGGGGGQPEEGSKRVEEWLSATDNYEGVLDHTDQNRAVVTVGAPGNGGNNAFEPPAIRVSPEMTVRWDWSGEGTHNVVEENGVFESGPPESDPDEPFSFTFSNPRTFRYYCERHEGRGMRGAVVVGQGTSGEGTDGGTGTEGGDGDAGGGSGGGGTGYDNGGANGVA